MFVFKHPPRLWAILVLFLAGLPITLRSQELLRYSGPYQAGEYRGEAIFNYKVVDSDTVLDGPFQLERSSLQALIDKQDASFSFSGGFQDNYPEGEWRFQFGEFKSDRASRVVDYQYRVKVSGVQQEAYGIISKGRPNGRWIYAVQHIKESEVDTTLFRSTIEYDQGIPQRSFRIENENNTLIGRCLRDGLAHDEWTMFANDGAGDTESWYFENGLLKRISTVKDNQTETLDLYADDPSEKATINLDERYLNILRLKVKVEQPSATFHSGLYPLLSENAGYYSKIDDILSELGDSDFKPAFRVLVDHFPLDSLEIAQLDSIKILHSQSRDISTTLLENTQLNILRLTDDRAQFYYDVISAFSERFVQPLDKTVKYFDQDILPYVSREVLMTGLWPEKPSPQIQIVGEGSAGEIFTGPRAAQFDFSENSILAAYRMAQYSLLSLESIQASLKDQLTKEKRQQDLIEMEEKLIDQSNTLNQLIDSLLQNASGDVKKALERIKEVSNNNLSSYAGITDVNEKLDYARQLVACNEQLKLLAETIGALPARDKQIEELYEDDIWNPFMATIMTEEVNKRITAAYRKVLIPYFLERVNSELNCKNAGNTAQIINKVHERMLELREEDTSKLERKLKREQDTEMILDLFNLQSIGE